MEVSQYVIIISIIAIFIGFSLSFWTQFYFLKLWKRREKLLFRQIGLTIHNDFKKILVKVKGGNKIFENSNFKIFLSFSIYFTFWIASLVVLSWLESTQWIKPMNIALSYLIPIFIYLIFVLIHILFFIKKNLAKDKAPLDKDLKTIELYFNNLKNVASKSEYDFRLLSDKSRIGNMQLKVVKQKIMKKINKLKLIKLDNDYIVLYLIYILSKEFINRIKNSHSYINMYENNEKINTELDFNYELFFLKYILQKLINL